MQRIIGKQIIRFDRAELVERIGGFREMLLDLGTGDGRFALHTARSEPGCFALGVDACRENLRESARKAPANALFLLANARMLPAELQGIATRITINFPWGSLLGGLLTNDTELIGGLREIARPGALLDIRLNGSALAETGCSPLEGAALIREALRSGGFEVGALELLDRCALRACPTSWAKRLASGRDPSALHLRAAAPLTNHRHLPAMRAPSMAHYGSAPKDLPR